MKKGGVKEENTQLLKQGFPNSIERWRKGVGNFAWRNFDPSVLLSC